MLSKNCPRLLLAIGLTYDRQPFSVKIILDEEILWWEKYPPKVGSLLSSVVAARFGLVVFALSLITNWQSLEYYPTTISLNHKRFLRSSLFWGVLLFIKKQPHFLFIRSNRSINYFEWDTFTTMNCFVIEHHPLFHITVKRCFKNFSIDHIFLQQLSACHLEHDSRRAPMTPDPQINRISSQSIVNSPVQILIPCLRSWMKWWRLWSTVDNSTAVMATLYYGRGFVWAIRSYFPKVVFCFVTTEIHYGVRWEGKAGKKSARK